MTIAQHRTAPAEADGGLAVPAEVAHEVATHARAVLLADSTIDTEAVEAFYYTGV